MLFCDDDIYKSDANDAILSIKTYYEQQWINRGLNIKYLKFILSPKINLVEPDVEIELDPYRSYNRNSRSQLEKKK
jgi:tRNA (guanine-N7-)-methyltransferase